MSMSIGAGDLLIAPPNMLDPRFRGSVLLLTHHDPDLSMGLCLNKQTEHTLSSILEPINLDLDRDPEIFWGGPVAQNTVWMLHDIGWRIENTVKVNDDWAVTSHHHMFHMMNQGNWPDRYRIMIGHAGWAPGQLENELAGNDPWDHDHSWLIASDPDPDWLIGCEPNQMWSMACSFAGQRAVETWMSQ